MNNFEQLHPEIIKDVAYKQSKFYRRYDENGTLVEAFDKNEEGQWVDVLERELLRLAIAETQKELDKMNSKEEEEYGNDEV